MAQSVSKGENLIWQENTLNVGLCLDMYKLIPFQLDMRIDTTEWCSLMLVLVTSNFIQGHRI